MPLPCRVDRTILFICTGNYYRSRFAEALFNHHAELRGLNWRAISRGLAIDRVIEINKLSRFTLAAMLQRGIKRQHTSEDLNALTSLDLIETDLAIAMCEAEHRPMMMEKYPLWVDHVIYWRVRDLPDSQPCEAIPEIERQVFLLLDGISASNPIDRPVAGCLMAQRLIPTGERSGLQTGTATTESVLSCVRMKS